MTHCLHDGRTLSGPAPSSIVAAPMTETPGHVFAVRRLRVLPVAVALVAGLALATAFNFVWFGNRLLHAIVRSTGGWLNATLLANLCLLGVVVGGALCGLGRARPRDLGLRARQLVPAVLATALMWLALQLATALVAWAGGEALVGAPARSDVRAPFGSDLIAQLFGNALHEEILFRGCLLVQIGLWLSPGELPPPRRVQWRALLISQALFALQHIPNRLAFGAWHGVAGAVGDLALLLVSGLCFAGVFVRTGNLLVAVGLHALGNCPTMLWRSPEWLHPTVLFVATLLLLAFGPRWFRR